MKIKVKKKAPNFKLNSTSSKTFELSKVKGGLVIYFYPKDATPGCTKEACNFRDRWQVFQDHKIKVLGISKDGDNSHKKFIQKHSLPFTLLTDSEPCPVASEYQSYGLKKFMGREYMGMMRHTFVIDSNGKIELIYRKVKAEIMANQIISDLDLE